MSASSRKSSTDSVKQRSWCRKSNFASSGSGANSSVSSSIDRGSRSSASKMDRGSRSSVSSSTDRGSRSSTSSKDGSSYGARVLPPKSTKSKKKGANIASAHKTKYYATPAYQATPKIENIPLPSFLKTDPRFNKKKAAAVAAAGAPKPKKAAKAVKKTVVKDDAMAKRGFRKIVREESEAKVQTAKPKSDQKPRLASLRGDASLKAAAAAAVATMAQPPMLAQRSLPPPLTTAGTFTANGFYRGSETNDVSSPWTPINAANAPLAAAASDPRLPAPMMPATGDPMPRALSLPASPHSMMTMLARVQTDPMAATPADNAAQAAEANITEDLFVEFVNNVRRNRASEAASNAAKGSQRQQEQRIGDITAHKVNTSVAPLAPRVHTAHAATVPSSYNQACVHFGAAQQHKPSLPAHYSGATASDAGDLMTRALSLPASPHSMMPMHARGQTDPAAATPATNAAEVVQDDTTKDLFMTLVNNVRRNRTSEAATNAAKASKRQQEQRIRTTTAHGGNIGVAPLAPRVYAIHEASLPLPHNQGRARFDVAEQQHKPSFPVHYGAAMAKYADYTMPHHHVNAMTYPALMMPAAGDPMPRASSLPASPHSMMPTLARGQTDPTAAMPADNAAQAAEANITEDLFMDFVNNVRRNRASEAASNAAKASQRQQEQRIDDITDHGGNVGGTPLAPRVHATHTATVPSLHHQVRAHFGASQHQPSFSVHYGGVMANNADYMMPRHHANLRSCTGGAHARAHDVLDPVTAYAQFGDVDAAAASTGAAADAQQVLPPALPSLAAVVGVASTAAAHDEAAAAEAELPQLPSLASLRL